MKSTPQNLELRFKENLENLISRDKKPLVIIAAFSGGPDSAALLSLLNMFSREMDFQLEAAYVNHGLRGDRETAEEEKRVRDMARLFNIPLHVKHLESGFLPWYSQKKSCGLEAAARAYRYHFLDSALNGRHGFLALGHNRDDQEETMIMRIFSFSGLEGLKGIPQKRNKYIRPLLNIRRREIEGYIHKTGLEVVRDSSNEQLKYLRNAVRHTLLPPLRDVFPGAGDSLVQTAGEISNFLEHYRSLLEIACPWKCRKGLWICREEQFRDIPFSARKMQIASLMNIVLDHGNPGHSGRIPGAFFSPLAKLGGNRTILLKGHGIILYRKEGNVILSREKKGKEEQVFFHLDENHPFVAPGWRMEFSRNCPVGGFDFLLPRTSSMAIILRSPQTAQERGMDNLRGTEAGLLLVQESRIIGVLDDHKFYHNGINREGRGFVKPEFVSEKPFFSDKTQKNGHRRGIRVNGYIIIKLGEQHAPE